MKKDAEDEVEVDAATEAALEEFFAGHRRRRKLGLAIGLVMLVVMGFIIYATKLRQTETEMEPQGSLVPVFRAWG